MAVERERTEFFEESEQNPLDRLRNVVIGAADKYIEANQGNSKKSNRVD